jgi:hypothetical protein
MCEILTGVALLNFDKSEEKGAAEAEYDGYTDVDWNSQRPDRDESGRALLECHEGHRWYSEQS